MTVESSKAPLGFNVVYSTSSKDSVDPPCFILYSDQEGCTQMIEARSNAERKGAFSILQSRLSGSLTGRVDPTERDIKSIICQGLGLIEQSMDDPKTFSGNTRDLTTQSELARAIVERATVSKDLESGSLDKVAEQIAQRIASMPSLECQHACMVQNKRYCPSLTVFMHDGDEQLEFSAVPGWIHSEGIAKFLLRL